MSFHLCCLIVLCEHQATSTREAVCANPDMPASLRDRVNSCSCDTNMDSGSASSVLEASDGMMDYISSIASEEVSGLATLSVFGVLSEFLAHSLRVTSKTSWKVQSATSMTSNACHLHSAVYWLPHNAIICTHWHIVCLKNRDIRPKIDGWTYRYTNKISWAQAYSVHRKKCLSVFT